MYPDHVPPAPQEQPLPPAPPPRRTTDPIVAIAGNATMLGIGYMFMRRPILSALALTGTGFLLWSAAVQTENPLWRILLPVWGLAMILHAWWLTRRTRTEHLVDLAGPGPAKRSRIFAIAAAALVLITVAWFRFDAWWIAHDAETAHAEGDCEGATTAIDRFDAVHRVAFGPATLRGEEEQEACDLLLAALDEAPAAGADSIEEYMDHPGALWDGAGPKRAELLLDAAMAADDGPELSTIEDAFAQLSTTLEQLPGQSETVRSTVENFMADIDEASPCSGYTVDDWLAGQSWDEPELTEPIAAAADQVPARMLGCAKDRTASGDTEGAGILFREFLSGYPDHELAGEAADGILDSGAYCGNPVAYQNAPAYDDDGPQPMQLLGAFSEGHDFPSSWLAETADDTTLVVCADAELGEFQESCQYSGSNGSLWVSFYAHKFTIKAYEFKTGELVADYTREIGNPCPNRLDNTFNTVYFSMSDGFMALASEFSDKDFRGMFSDLMD